MAIGDDRPPNYYIFFFRVLRSAPTVYHVATNGDVATNAASGRLGVFLRPPHVSYGCSGAEQDRTVLADTSMVPWLMFVAPLLWAWFWMSLFSGFYKWAKWVRETPKIGNLR
jgi:hypothetical protein